jgi:hypothetical protein
MSLTYDGNVLESMPCELQQLFAANQQRRQKASSKQASKQEAAKRQQRAAASSNGQDESGLAPTTAEMLVRRHQVSDGCQGCRAWSAFDSSISTK